MSIDQSRLWRRLETLSRLTDRDRPWTRRSFTPRFLEGRAWLAAEFRAAGLETGIDAGGNLIGRLEGTEQGLAPILIGSHSDTVPSGGRYDGILGVLAALEVAQGLIENGERRRHPLEVVDFLAEEPSEFEGLSCIGSRAMSGALTPEHLALRRADGMSLEEGIAYVGGRPQDVAGSARAPGSIAAYLELHIEQGRVLESEAKPIGIVTDIVGIRRERITVTGRADHAGATPMPLRSDALVGAARLIEAAYQKAMATSGDAQPLVATFGKIDVSPNAANAVPGEVVMTLEVRSGNEAAVSAFGGALVREVQPELDALRLKVKAEPISNVAPVACATVIRTAIADASRACGLGTRDLPSGAGHDGVFVSRLGPIGMIFVPCRDGRSHAPEEAIEPEQVADGARTLAGAVKVLDERLD
ncbi:MAG TPA: Zn-dependent hydrolase [Bosea sp. (in: a-proteobacteria)]|jgi:N-carbamoyl-L-amino-acid hydrolase|uniref:Zn-dependent hydrolase n=1 Tax=Bosea sp. (in: a-proteobacteria) TaxID=1871050 RepID=UPI002E0D2C06|nr:Zn-dependent hydrolase [Bosea sp. (in: a-proteobacteria)]